MFDQSLRVQLTRAMLIDDIEQVIRRTPGLTATEIARMLYGADGYHQRVGTTCTALVKAGRAEQRGKGGPGDPFIYFPIKRFVAAESAK